MMRLSPPIPQPKAKPAKLARDQRKRDLEREDRKESAKVKKRSGGRCEAVVDDRTPFGRCGRRAVHVHHLLSGIGVRARGRSRLAEHKLHVCDRCHADIHGHVLRRVGGPTPVWTDTWERSR